VRLVSAALVLLALASRGARPLGPLLAPSGGSWLVPSSGKPRSFLAPIAEAARGNYHQLTAQAGGNAYAGETKHTPKRPKNEFLGREGLLD
jgi:hypothetical protein